MMNKPIFPAVGMGIGMFIGHVAGNYFRGNEPTWFSALVVGISAGLFAYPIFRWRWKQKQAKPSSRTSDV